MRLTKRQLKRIIQEECGAVAAPAASVAPVMDSLAESAAPEQEVMLEMQNAAAALEVVVESANQAAALCQDCAPAIAAQAPVMEAVVAQANALQEMLEAQAAVVAENAAVAAPMAPAEVAPVMERRRIRRRR